MTSIQKYSDKIIFVCYTAGSGGERVSVEISQLPGMVPLSYYTANGNRTVITNDIFDKKFLKPSPMLEIVESAAQSLNNNPITGLHVVPSHHDFKLLLPYFSNSKFIRLLANTSDQPQLDKNLYEKIWLGYIPTFSEFTGYCLCYTDKVTLSKLLAEKKLNLNMTIGEIHCALKNQLPTPQNSKKLFTELAKKSFNEILPADHPQVLDIPYQSAMDFLPNIKQFILANNN
jgi:hypothetical protein